MVRATDFRLLLPPLLLALLRLQRLLRCLLLFRCGCYFVCPAYGADTIVAAAAVVAAVVAAKCCVPLCAFPFPIHNNEEVIDLIMSCVTKNTKLALIDTVTSPTGLKMPFEILVDKLESMGVNVLLDAAHGIGMFPLDLEKIGASFTTSNCHKWLCSQTIHLIKHTVWS